VLYVQRGYIEAEMEGRGSDEQILNGYGDSLCGLFAFDLSGKLSDGQGNWMNDQPAEDIFCEYAASLTAASASGAKDAMGQFDHRDRGDRAFSIAQCKPQTVN